MDTVQTEFSKVEYVTIFGTFIYGYVAARFLYGWGMIIQRRKELRFSKEHLLWTVFMFFLLLDIWWGSWLKGMTIARNKVAFFESMFSPLIFYMISVVYLPDLKVVKGDLREYFRSISRPSYLLFVCLFISFFINDLFLQESPVLDFVVNTLGIALALAGYFINRKVINRLILAVAFAALFFHIHSLRSYAGQSMLDNFSLVEYLNIFVAFIFGAVASNFFAGWGRMIYRYREISLHKEYLLWTFLAFGLLMDVWWGQWSRSEAVARSFYTFLLSILTPFIFYFQSVVIFPRLNIAEAVDLGQFYQANKRVIILLFGGILTSNLLIALMFEDRELWSVTNILRFSGTALAISGAIITNDKYHRLILGLGWIMLVVHTFRT